MPGPRFTRFAASRRAGAAAIAAAIALALMVGRAGAATPSILDFEKYNIASRSMEPTLLLRDHIVAFPLPKPARGDLVAYRNPKADAIYIKRIAGLPGDRVQMKDSVLHINGEPVARERVEDFLLTRDDGTTTAVAQWRETLPDGTSYRTLDLVENGPLDNTPVVTVPVGHYFVIGDNRDNSTDSRMPSVHGTVPAGNIVGRAEFVYFSIAEGESVWRFWRWPWSVRWNRVLMRVR